MGTVIFGIFVTFPESLSVLAGFLSCGALKQRFLKSCLIVPLLNVGLFLYNYFGHTNCHLVFTYLLDTTQQVSEHPTYPCYTEH